MANEPGNWIDQAVRRCWQLLAAVVALVLALHLLAAALPWLLGAIGIALTIYVVVQLVRQRLGGW